MDFPVIGTKVSGLTREFDLMDPARREEYFEAKVGKEVRKIREYLKHETFVAYLLSKKNAGKGTYARLFIEVVGGEHLAHISVGDVVRAARDELKARPQGDLYSQLAKLYRGYLSLDDAVAKLVAFTQSQLLPIELILALLKAEIAKVGRKAVFVDGLPRDTDQISYSLFFRDLINFRDDPDFFVLFETPTTLIDQRIKTRLVCPKCKLSKNILTNPTFEVEYDRADKSFHLLCDNPACGKVRLVRKEGDDLGVEPIRERLDKEAKLIQLAMSLYGVPKIFLRNSIPVSRARKYFDRYEIAPEYVYKWDQKTKSVEMESRELTFVNDEGVASNSFRPEAVVVSMVKQIAEILA